MSVQIVSSELDGPSPACVEYHESYVEQCEDKRMRIGFAAALMVLAGGARAQKQVTYSGDIKGILDRYCSPCHFGNQRAVGLSLQSVASMLKGGGHGPTLDPGRGSESQLVLNTDC